VYQVIAEPGRVTDIALQPGEALSGVGGVAAGDTVRWVIGQSESGAGAGRQTHVLVKPTQSGLATNLVIATDRRAYHVELRSEARGYMPAVSWRYPETELIALKGAPPAVSLAAEPKSEALAEADLTRLCFDYRIEGRAPWRPVRVFDDGRRTVIDFPPQIASAQMPPLFVLAANGRGAELVNYRVQGHRMVVDGIFQAAELRMGAERRQLAVRLVREASRP
jgi:type IV secretion system protein VirB9